MLIVDFKLSLPPHVTAVFRALVTLEGTLEFLVPNFKIVDESRKVAGRLLAETMTPASIEQAVRDELVANCPCCTGSRDGSISWRHQSSVVTCVCIWICSRTTPVAVSSSRSRAAQPWRSSAPPSGSYPRSSSGWLRGQHSRTR